MYEQLKPKSIKRQLADQMALLQQFMILLCSSTRPTVDFVNSMFLTFNGGNTQPVDITKLRQQHRDLAAPALEAARARFESEGQVDLDDPDDLDELDPRVGDVAPEFLDYLTSPSRQPAAGVLPVAAPAWQPAGGFMLAAVPVSQDGGVSRQATQPVQEGGDGGAAALLLQQQRAAVLQQLANVEEQAQQQRAPLLQQLANVEGQAQQQRAPLLQQLANVEGQLQQLPAPLLQHLANVEGQLQQRPAPQQQYLALAPQGARLLPDALACAAQPALGLGRTLCAHRSAQCRPWACAFAVQPVHPTCVPADGRWCGCWSRAGPQQLLGAFEQQVQSAGGSGGLVGMVASILLRHGAQQQQMQTFAAGPLPASRGVGSRRPVQQADVDRAGPGGPHRNGSRRRPLPTDGTALAIPLLSAFDSIPGVSWLLTCTHVLLMGAS